MMTVCNCGGDISGTLESIGSVEEKKSRHARKTYIFYGSNGVLILSATLLMD
jgi:hypothetical protein